MSADLQKKLTELATELDVPGVSVGVLIDGEEHYAFHGITSVENPLDVDDNTMFQFGSTGKTYTATAIMRLVEEGRVDLDATVRTYVPELRLKDEAVARDRLVARPGRGGGVRLGGWLDGRTRNRPPPAASPRPRHPLVPRDESNTLRFGELANP